MQARQAMDDPRRRVLRGRGVAALLAALAVSAAASAAPAAVIRFAATLDGAQAGTGSAGTGSGTFVMDTVAKTLTVDITYTGLSGPVLLGHIHGYAAPGATADIVFPFSSPASPIHAVWNYADADEAQIIAGLAYANLHTAMHLAGEIRGQIVRTPSCGDGITDGGEQCDSGNPAGGGCCDAACHYKVEGSECGSSLCDFARCDAAGACVNLLRGNCRTASRGDLAINDDTDDDDPEDEDDVVDAGDQVVWSWARGQAVSIGDLADPGRTSTFALCIYAGASAEPKMQFIVPPGQEHWSTHLHPTTRQPTGFYYKDASGSADGVNRITTKIGATNKARVHFKALGPNLPDPPVGPLPLPVTVQLVNNTNDVCFQTVFPAAEKNTADNFKARVR